MSAEPLLDAAKRIADGLPVDWDRVGAGATHADAETIEQLALLQAIASNALQIEIDETFEEARVPLDISARAWGDLTLHEVLGVGASGAVFRAWDPKLERDIALKLYRPDLDPARVIDEGRKLARVKHPNVVTVFGADQIGGRPGIWMELVRGRRLDQLVADFGPFSERETALVGLELAGALSAVHRAGLVHRDVKAQNVLRDETGRIVLMDLGASVLADQRAGSGALSGTPLYMSPEALAGAESTTASDLYSVGVLLFFLLTGAFPVRAETLPELRDAHRAGRRERLDRGRPGVSPALARLVDRLLSPDPADRPVSADDVAAELRRVIDRPTGAATRRRRRLAAATAAALCVTAASAAFVLWPKAQPPTIAVLSIRNLTGDSSRDYFAEGLTEVLVSSLGSLPQVRVSSHGAVAALERQHLSSADLAARLHATYVVSGAVTSVAGRFRMNVQLIDPKTDRVLFGNELNRLPEEAVSAQSEIARMVGAKLALDVKPELSAKNAARSIPAAAIDAYAAALAAFNRGSTHLAEAVGLFDQARRAAPNFAPAFARYSEAKLQLIGQPNGASPSVVDLNEVRDAALKAIEIDPASPDGYFALGTIQFYYDWDFNAAEQSLRRAVELSPGFGLGHQRLAMFLISRRRFTEAIAEAEEAVVADPNLPLRFASLATVYYYAHDFARAREADQRALAIDPVYPQAHFSLGRIASAEGNHEEAIREIQQAIAVDKRPGWVVELARAYASAGRADLMSQTLADLDNLRAAGAGVVGADNFGYIALANGRTDEAVRIIDEALSKRVVNVLWLAVDPRVDALKGDHRYPDLLKSLGL